MALRKRIETVAATAASISFSFTSRTLLFIGFAKVSGFVLCIICDKCAVFKGHVDLFSKVDT